MIGDEYIINNIETYNNLEKNNNYSIKNIFYLLMVSIGYNNTKFIINWMRKIRGVPNA